MSSNTIYEELCVEASKLVGPGDYKPGEDNLFDMGFHSLTILFLVSHIRERYHVGLEVRDVFERPSLTQLAEEVTRRRDLAE
jgi:aryl carrier-like protein